MGRFGDFLALSWCIHMMFTHYLLMLTKYLWFLAQGGIVGSMTGICRFYNISGMLWPLRFPCSRCVITLIMLEIYSYWWSGYGFLGTDNHLQIDDEICLYGKKKAPCKKITGFQVAITSPDCFVFCFWFLVHVNLPIHFGSEFFNVFNLCSFSHKILAK